ncbi:MAG: FAD-dependent oxidoreductase [Acidimicrobiales bacterium]
MRVVVVGGGVIGLAVAWQAARRGADVVVVDERPGRGASWVAGGMLAPVAEAYEGEEALLRLGLASAARWPLRRRPGRRGRGGPRLLAQRDDGRGPRPGRGGRAGAPARPADAAGPRRRAVDVPSGPATRAGAGPHRAGALWLADDHQVDNRLLVAGLLTAADRAGVGFVTQPASRLAAGAVGLADGGSLAADGVVVATGAHPVPISTPDGDTVTLPVRPVKGQILRVQATPGAVCPTHTVRGPGIYVIPRPHGEIAIGATSEERGFDTTVTSGAVLELLRDAWELLPGLAETTFVEAVAGLRPGTPDNAPLLGPLDPTGDGPGVVVATGHYRNGVLLAPITADLVVSCLLDGGPTDDEAAALLAPCRPDRFTEVAACR